MTGLTVTLLAGAAPPPARDGGTVRVFRSLTIRMPLVRRQRATPPPPFVEKRGPRCIVAADIAGAAVTGPAAIDFALRGAGRLRARLESACPALDFYGGFYMSPGGDGLVCADRDVIRTRAGGECGIDRFRRLVPEKPPKP